MNQSVQGRFGDREAIGELQTDLIDGFDQIIIADVPPLVTRKRASSCYEGDLGGGSEIGSAVAGVGVIGVELICTGSMSSLTLSALMTHEMDPTVKIWPGCGRDEEPAEKAILFDKETSCTPLPGAPPVDRISSAVHRGVSRDGRLIGRGACNQEQEGNRDTRVI